MRTIVGCDIEKRKLPFKHIYCMAFLSGVKLIITTLILITPAIS